MIALSKISGNPLASLGDDDVDGDDDGDDDGDGDDDDADDNDT